MIPRSALLLAAVLAAAAPAATHDTEAARLFAGRVAGAPVNCLSADRAGNIQAIDARTLVYRQSAHRVWRNDLPDVCPGLDDDSIIVIELWGSGPCKGDHFRTIERSGSIPGPICRFGSFVPYDKPKS